MKNLALVFGTIFLIGFISLAHASEIANRAHDAFREAPGLSEGQKIKLKEIVQETMAKSDKLKKNFIKAKAEYFSALVNPTADKKLVNAKKQELIKLNQQRLNVMFQAADQVEKVIGKSDEAAQFYKKLFDQLEATTKSQ